MIVSDGVKAFRGVMVIHPRNAEDIILEGDWVYRPENKCWYGCGRSFGEDICEICEDKGDR